jgi:hypothetical protein
VGGGCDGKSESGEKSPHSKTPQKIKGANAFEDGGNS